MELPHDTITSLTDPLDEPEESPRDSRLIWFGVIIGLGILMLLTQLYRIQIVQGSQYRTEADNNRFRIERVPPARGVIYDRNHVVLARNRPSYTVGVIPSDLPQGSARAAVFRRLANILSMKPEDVQSIYDKGLNDPFTLVPIKTRVSSQVAFTVEERHLDLPGVHISLDPIREYTLGSATASILGYVGPITDAEFQRLKDEPNNRYAASDSIGQVGIEATFENELHGAPGQRQMEVDATGREVRALGVTNPSSGHNLNLTIDANLQQAIVKMLDPVMTPTQVASVIVLDPSNGQVLAMVDRPSYDDNLFARGIQSSDLNNLLNDPRHPLVSNSVGAAYPPGDTFELVTAAAGLQEKVISDTQKIDCAGFISVPNRYDPTIQTQLPDRKAFGPQDVVSAIADSCNVFFYEVGGGEPNGKWPGLDVNRLAKYAQMFGLGQTSGIDLLGEVSGIVPNVRWKRQMFNQEWVELDTYEMSVGQGYMTVTPIQMADLVAAIANGGTLYRPQLVLSETDDQGNVVKAFQPDPQGHLIIDPTHLAEVRAGMVAAMGKGTTPDGTNYDGTAQAAAVPGLTVAGKTGTVPFGVPDAQGNRDSHGWFIGFAPADHPKIAVAVFLDHGTGEKDAASVARQIFEYYKAHGLP